MTSRPGVPRILSQASIARVVATALRAAGAPNPASLSVLLVTDGEIAGLNEAHLGHQGPTDVLSFPLLPRVAFPAHAGGPLPRTADESGASPALFVLPPRARPHLGDIALSVERAVAQAADGRGGQTSDRTWAAQDEVRLLLTHGALHICGWDHADPAEERAMRALERELLGVPTT
ncbi:MAG: rRNA maturation RNase YbeY [Candidatus Limnocylindrales bacterium]